MPYKALGTDITYLYYGNGQRSYLSVIRDLATSEILAHRLSSSLSMELSIDPLAQTVTRLGDRKLEGVVLHSDQGFHYTHPSFIKRLADLGVVQSMSRKGNMPR